MDGRSITCAKGDRDAVLIAPHGARMRGQDASKNWFLFWTVDRCLLFRNITFQISFKEDGHGGKGHVTHVVQIHMHLSFNDGEKNDYLDAFSNENGRHDQK